MKKAVQQFCRSSLCAASLRGVQNIALRRFVPTVRCVSSEIVSSFENTHQKIAGRQRFYKFVDVKPFIDGDSKTKVLISIYNVNWL